jgi:hypothetical protein
MKCRACLCPFAVFRKVKTSRPSLEVESIEPKHKHNLALLETNINQDDEATS